MKINLRKKKLTTGKYSLYIDYYKGKVIDQNGKSKNNREFEYLKEYLYISPQTPSEKKENAETLLRLNKYYLSEGQNTPRESTVLKTDQKTNCFSSPIMIN
ncbi:hypothetical protein [Salinimicrobium sp. GXAS 041]|uniref:hypothetical protein n=1 Tax=Salinimicrobium sp. GXAS 041 TaxID=3400806 RepID=UPI003C71FD8F